MVGLLGLCGFLVARALLERARAAVMSVYTPQVMRRRLLDGLAGEVLLRRSVASVTARVERLERYAHRVQEADAALRAREALDNNDKYRGLLARTDDAEGLRDLEARGAALEETLAESVRVASDAGRTLSVGRP
ncbi:hypothetical protein ACU635_22220 [[Actinomadura] parvosata]|uniref:hypothetical protein n=1 Tax=[Actinomadura] parvosata TaxID=1955412 RepID=UPI00406C633A